MYCYTRLRDLREDADLTQKEVGHLLNTTQQQYAKYEAGVQEIPVHHLMTLADFYQVSTDYILEREEWVDSEFQKTWKHLTYQQKESILNKINKRREN